MIELHLKIVGVLVTLLSLIHIGFPRYFLWSDQLKKLSLINKQMMEAHTFFIAIVLIGIGLLAFFHGDALHNSEFGNHIAAGLAFFWLLRLIFQLFFYSPRLWLDKPFETTVHIVFTAFIIYLITVFLITSRLFT